MVSFEDVAHQGAAGVEKTGQQGIFAVPGKIEDEHALAVEKDEAYAADFTGDAFGCLLDDGVQLRADMLFLGQQRVVFLEASEPGLVVHLLVGVFLEFTEWLF